MRELILFSLFFFCACFLDAQSQTPLPPLGADINSLASRQMDFFVRSVQHDKEDEARQREVAAREEEIARYQFLAKANKFVALWGAFATRLNDEQTFDAKLAKKVSKAFHELEKSDGWPIREHGVANNPVK